MDGEVIIRPISFSQDADDIVEIWYQASITAHDFISESFWFSLKNEMRNSYLFAADTLVALYQEKIIGFASVREDKLEALFIEPAWQGQGVGVLLLDKIRQSRKVLLCNVYKKNAIAYKFYASNGFILDKQGIDDNTGETEIYMIWRSEHL